MLGKWLCCFRIEWCLPYSYSLLLFSTNLTWIEARGDIFPALITIHVFAVELDTCFIHHLLERVHILQVMSPWMVTTMQIILSRVCQAFMDNHFSSTTIWLPVTYVRWGLNTMAGLSGLIIVWQNLHPLLWEMECPGVIFMLSYLRFLLSVWSTGRY